MLCVFCNPWPESAFMNGIIGDFRIGEEITLALDTLAGDPATVTAIIAKIKPAKISGNRVVLDVAAASSDMMVSPQGSAGWLVSLGHLASAGLAAGIYGIDARLTIAGSVEMTEQTAFISVTQAAVA
jgi:hypothetical protein